MRNEEGIPRISGRPSAIVPCQERRYTVVHPVSEPPGVSKPCVAGKDADKVSFRITPECIRSQQGHLSPSQSTFIACTHPNQLNLSGSTTLRLNISQRRRDAKFANPFTDTQESRKPLRCYNLAG